MKIMFICTGNICRSAMAHWLMEKKLKDNDIKEVEVYSCGIFAQDGDGVEYNTIEVMKEYDVDIKGHRATNIQNSKICDMDLILCATISHKQSVIRMYPEVKDKTFTLKEYVKYDEKGEDVELQDPWGYDIEVYRFSASQIDECLNKLIKKISLD